ncbi:hypothetical protein CoNPh35_CDS0070 [Staphylococcus phage S-CoN_Ph35]|nr:hypothetical protein CoNPh35_CDS0070 [Staphylococcus phage S-CoN_Ph35]
MDCQKHTLLKHYLSTRKENLVIKVLLLVVIIL